jgi:NAD(P)H-quinone oxidoreductase subunit 2
MNEPIGFMLDLFNFPVFNALAEQNVHMLSPELCVLSGLLFALFKGVTKHQQDAWLYALIALIFALGCLAFQASLLFMPQLNGASIQLIGGSIGFEPFSWVIRGFILLGTLLTVLMSKTYVAKRSQSPAEFYSLLLAASLGGLLLAGARDLVMLFVSLETLGISSYILSGYFRDDSKSAEASLKYLTYGGVCSAILLFGFSIIYGLSGGQTQLAAIASVLQVPTPMTASTVLIVPLAAILILAAFCFKLSLAPFHLWAPDVYEGAPVPVAGFLSVVSKTAAFAITIRVIQTIFPNTPGITEALIAISAISMVWGNIAAILQTNLKRLLAFSTIAQAGYMVIGLLVGTAASTATLLFYLMGYLFTNLGAFAVVKSIEDDLGTSDIDAMAGIASKRPMAVFSLSVFLLSLAGLPVTVGFFAKFFLFQSAIAAMPQLTGLVILALLTSVVSLFYYVNVMRIMIIQEPSDAVRYLKTLTYRLVPSGTALTTIIALVGVLVMGLLSNDVLMFLQFSASAVTAAQVSPNILAWK